MTLALAAPAERRARLDLSWPILIAFAAILIALIVLPMSWLVYFSVTDKAGSLTLGNFTKIPTRPTLLHPLGTTRILAASSAIICRAVAAPTGPAGARTPIAPRPPI